MPLVVTPVDKLARPYGPLNTPDGSTLMVTKNLSKVSSLPQQHQHHVAIGEATDCGSGSP